MRKIVCDRCGAEITGDRIGYVAVSWRAASDDSLMHDNPYEHMDFCEHCMNVIVACIDNVDIKREEPEEPEAAEDPVQEEPEEDEEDQEEDENALWEDEEKPEPKPEKKPVRKKGVNYARLRSMIRDGMSNETIAENLGLTMKQFYYARKRAEQLYIAGRI